MLERMRSRLADLIYPAKAERPGFRLMTGNQTPNIPIYSEMSTKKATREGYKISIWVYRAVRTIIQAGSAVPWIVTDKNGEPIPNHPLELVLKNPNPEFSGQDLIELLIAHLELVGNALWQPLIVGGQIKEIWPVMPDLVKPIPSNVRGEWLRGWEVTIEGRPTILPPEQFIHFLQVDPGNPYWGMSPLMAAARTVDTDNEAQDTQKISMQNRGLTDGVFTHEAPLTQEQFEEARRQVREEYLNKSRRREPWILGAGASWHQMSLTPVEMDFIQSRLANLRGIAAAFGIDPWWLGDRSTSTYNNVIEARKALYHDVIIPLLDDVKSTLNLRIAPMYGDIRIAYDLSGIPAMRADYGQKVDQAKALWAMGVPFQQINERLEMGFEEFSGWDSGYLPINLLPTGSPRPEPEAGEKSLNLESDEEKAAYWKAVDRRKVGWWGIADRKIEPLYRKEGQEVQRAVTRFKELDTEKMTRAAERAIKKLIPDWEKTLTAVLGAVLEDFGQRTADDLGAKAVSPDEAKWRFEPFTAATKLWLQKHAAESIKTIAETNLSDVAGVLVAAKEDNLTVPQTGQKVKAFYDDRSSYKAMRVARTEVSAAAGFGQREAAKQSGIVKTKKWLSSRDARVRDSHQMMDGESQPLNERYTNGLMYPGDPGGNPAETIMCRCVEQYASK